MTSYFTRSVSFQGIANLPKLLQTQGIKSREAGQPILGQALSPRVRRAEVPDEFDVATAVFLPRCIGPLHPLASDSGSIGGGSMACSHA
jgi:hypothetical protein